uniref:Uncharacterized protein n=1 Tax=Glossina palpalis gambiensis TaxID=67801 RepID=A0A1B0BWT7_9MUSC
MLKTTHDLQNHVKNAYVKNGIAIIVILIRLIQSMPTLQKQKNKNSPFVTKVVATVNVKAAGTRTLTPSQAVESTSKPLVEKIYMQASVSLRSQSLFTTPPTIIYVIIC